MADSTDLAQAPDSGGAAGPQGDFGPRESAPVKRGNARRIGIACGSVVAIAVAGAWIERERIARHFVDQQLSALDLPVTYRVESIGPGVQVLRHIVVGDPRHPDATIDRAEIHVSYGIGAPSIGTVRLIQPRVHGTWLDNRLSFGALDKVLFGPESTTPFRLPGWELDLVDGRGTIDSDHGRLSLAAQGRGRLRDGFAGTLSALVPQGSFGGCGTGRATLDAKVTIRAEQPRLQGPLKIDNVHCADGTRLATASLDIDATVDKDLKGLTAKTGMRGGAAHLAGTDAESLALDSTLALRDGALSGRVAGNAGGVARRVRRVGREDGERIRWGDEAAATDDQVAVAVAVRGGAEIRRVVAHHQVVERLGVDEVGVGVAAAEIG